MGSDLLSSGITMGMMGGFGGGSKMGGGASYGVNPTAYAPSLSPTYGALGFNRQVNADIMSNPFSRPRRFSNIND